MFIKTQKILEAGFENDLIGWGVIVRPDEFYHNHPAQRPTESSEGWYYFFVQAFGPGMIYPMQADNNASTP